MFSNWVMPQFFVERFHAVKTTKENICIRQHVTNGINFGEKFVRDDRCFRYISIQCQNIRQKHFNVCLVLSGHQCVSHRLTNSIAVNDCKCKKRQPQVVYFVLA